MLNRLRHHWPAKLGSLVAAAVVWYLLHQAIRSQSGPASSSRPATSGAPGRFP